MALQFPSQYSCTPSLFIFLTEVNCLSLNLFLTTSSHFSWRYRALWAHTYIFSMSDWRKNTSKSFQIVSHPWIKGRPHPLKWCNTNWDGHYVECFLWHSQVLQLPHLALLCSLWIVPWPSVSLLPTDKPSPATESASPAPVQIFCTSILTSCSWNHLFVFSTRSGPASCLPWLPFTDAFLTPQTNSVFVLLVRGSSLSLPISSSRSLPSLGLHNNWNTDFHMSIWIHQISSLEFLSMFSIM